MTGDWLLVASIFAGVAAAQELPIRPERDERGPLKEAQPQFRRPPLLSAPNARELAERYRSEAQAPARCSIPLITIVPKAVPYMPTFKPPVGIDNGISRLRMPAPPCDREQREQLQSQRKSDGR